MPRSREKTDSLDAQNMAKAKWLAAKKSGKKKAMVRRKSE